MASETTKYCVSKSHGKNKAEITEKALALAKKYPWAKGLCYDCIRNQVVILVNGAKAQMYSNNLDSCLRPVSLKNPASQVREGETTLVKVSKVLMITTEAILTKILEPEPPRLPLMRSRRLTDGSQKIVIEKQSVGEFVELVGSNSPSLERLNHRQREILAMRYRIIKKMIADGALD